MNPSSFNPLAALNDPSWIKNAQLIDVRNDHEFAMMSLPGSKLIPLGRLLELIETAVPDRQTPLLVYCAAGARAAQACALLQQLGYEQVANGGGISSVAHLLQTVSD